MAEASGGLFRNPRTGREIIGRFVLRAMGAILLAALCIWTLDYLVLRVRIATNRQPFGTVTVRPLYAVPQKDQKTQFMMGDPTDQQCVNSLFSHLSDSPCWYLSRHADQQINM